MANFGSDREMTVLGVPGRLTHLTTDPAESRPGLWLHQKWISQSQPIASYGNGARLRAEMRFDDECHNGHNTFSMTGDIYKVYKGGRREDIACGCLHDDIAKVFPELAPLIKWHLTSTDGPMHGIANAVFLAGNRDCWGKLKGEPRDFETALQFGNNPIKRTLKKSFAEFLRAAGHGPRYEFEVLPIYHRDHGHQGKHQFAPKYTFGGYGKEWHECPFDSEQEALDFLCALQTCEPKFIRIPTAWGEGKERELDNARRACVWPDAPDEILMSEPDVLRAALKARMPALIAEFRTDMERAGFIWEPAGVAP